MGDKEYTFDELTKIAENPFEEPNEKEKEKGKERVGYGRPPKASQFPPKTSGNPAGRPAGTRGTYKLLEDILNQKVTITQNGRPVKISKKMAILFQAVNNALKGDPKAIRDLLPHLLASDAKIEERQCKIEGLKAEDQAIIDAFINNQNKNKGE